MAYTDSKKKLFDALLKLKNECGLIGLKAEFEAEGSRYDELIMLNEIVFRGNTDLIVKIGGCEAMRDMDQCKILGTHGIMAPMIETPFAMSKFVGAGKQKFGENYADIEWVINAETITCFENFEKILEVGKDFIDTVVVGRSDLSASMGINRNDIDGDIIFDKVKSFATMTRKFKNIKSSFGGGVSVDTIPFIMKLGDLIDQYETRKVILKRPTDEKYAEKQILAALDFEMAYLKYKKEFYSMIAEEDDKRIYALEERLKENGAKVR